MAEVVTVVGLVAAADSLINLIVKTKRILDEVGRDYESEKVRLELLKVLLEKLKRRASTLPRDLSATILRALDLAQQKLGKLKKKAEKNGFFYRTRNRKRLNNGLDEIEKLLNPCVTLAVFFSERWWKRAMSRFFSFFSVLALPVKRVLGSFSLFVF